MTKFAAPDVWHVITCEYPPQVGGVGDFAASVAAGLAASGEAVHVWCPPAGEPAGSVASLVSVHRELGTFSRQDWQHVGELLDRLAQPRRLLVQWVPHGYGYRSMNVSFARWLAVRARRGDRVEIVVHEPFLAWSARPLRILAATAHRVMLKIAAARAERVWVSIPAWEDAIRPLVPPHVPIDRLPIPSPFRVADDPAGVARLRQHLAPHGERIVGHFSSHPPLVTTLLGPALESVLDSSDVRIALIGSGSRAFANAFLSERSRFAGRVEGTGILDPSDLSRHVQACDLLLQPYPDGVSTRRTTAIALLAHGKPTVTNVGPLSEPLWRESGAVALAAVPDARLLAAETTALLADERRRTDLSTAARRLYDRWFDVRHTIAALVEPQSPTVACPEHLAS